VLNQFDPTFSSPDFTGEGELAFSTIQGADEESPFVSGPATGGYADTTTGEGNGAQHVSTGNTGSSGQMTANHWTNLFDWKHGPLFWLMIFTFLYLGLLSLHVSYRIGR
jgi:hypothetical protein